MDNSWLQQCRRNGKYCDVKVYANCLEDEEPLEAHMIILGSRCPYFQQNFEASLPHIVVEGIEKNVLKILMDFIYHNNTEAIGPMNVFEVFEGAKILMLSQVQNACIQLVDRISISPSNCLKILTLGVSAQKKNLVESSITFFFKNSAMAESPEFLELGHELLQFIIKKGVILSSPAENLLRMTIRWIKHESHRLDLAYDLLMSLPLRDIGQEGVIKMFEDGTDESLKGQIFSTALRVVIKTFATPASSPAPTSPSPASPASSTLTVSVSKFPTISTPLLISTMEAVQGPTKGGAGVHHSKKRKGGGKCGNLKIKKSRKKFHNKEKPIKIKLTQKQNGFVNLVQVGTSSFHGNHNVHMVEEAASNGKPDSEEENGDQIVNLHGDKLEDSGLIYFIEAGPNDYNSCHLTSYNLNTKKYKQIRLGDFSPWRDRCGLIYHNDNIFVIGGKFADGRDARQVLVYSLRAALFRKDAPQPLEPRCDFQCVVLRNHIYAVAGCCQAGSTKNEKNVYEDDIVNCVERLPPQLPDKPWSWEPVDYVNRSRADYGMVAFGDKIYVFGGYAPSGPKKTMGPSCSVECYDPSLDSWTRLRPMPSAKFGHCAVAVNLTGNHVTATSKSDLIYILGGGVSYATDCLKFNHVDIYDPLTDSWTIGPSMMKGRQFGSGIFYNQNIYAIGGDSDDQPTMEKLSLSNNDPSNEPSEWAVVGNLKNTGQYGSVAFKL